MLSRGTVYHRQQNTFPVSAEGEQRRSCSKTSKSRRVVSPQREYGLHVSAELSPFG